MRIIRPTLLIVGEGRAEKNLLLHIRDLYTRDNNGCAVQVKDAKGHGALGTIKEAIRISKTADFDKSAALFDTDTDWTDAARKIARQGKIITLASDPCLEAWILQIAGIKLPNLTPAQYKARFEQKFGGPAHTPDLFEKELPKPVLDNARETIEVLNLLLTIIENR